MDNGNLAGIAHAFFIRGFEKATVRGVSVSDSTFKGVAKGSLLQGVGELLLRNVTVEPAR